MLNEERRKSVRKRRNGIQIVTLVVYKQRRLQTVVVRKFFQSKTLKMKALVLTELLQNKFTIRPGACDTEPLRLLTICNALNTLRQNGIKGAQKQHGAELKKGNYESSTTLE